MSASISVVIPCYNAAAFLREAIDSALAQTRPADEIIVVDDASTDGSVEVALSYGDRIKLLRSPNARGTGHGATANRGVMASQGEYIAFLHADDIWRPQHLEKVAGLLDEWTEVGVAFGRMEYFGANSGLLSETKYIDWDRPTNVFPIIMRTTILMPSAAVARRHVIAEIGGFDEGRPFLADDFDFFARCACRHPFISCLEPTVLYRCHESQCSANVYPSLINAFRYRVRIIEDLRKMPDQEAGCNLARDRTLRYWEEEIETAWRNRDLTGLKQMVRYGMGDPLYRPATRSYALKCKVPEWAIRMLDHLRQRTPAG